MRLPPRLRWGLVEEERLSRRKPLTALGGDLGANRIATFLVEAAA